jgi:membrane fusion protein (multidrug efflux system)
MAKKVALAVLAVLVIVGVLAGIKGAQIGAMINAGKNFKMPPTVVTATAATEETWQPTLSAIGSLVAVQQVTVAPESPGQVKQIAFQSGQMVQQGQLLVRLDTQVEAAQLASAEADAKLAKLQYERTKKLFDTNAISQAELDSAEARAASADAQVANLRGVIDRKTVKAPFSGRLGIRQVDPGAYVNSGTPIVTLQALGQMYVDFNMPQQRLSQLKNDQVVRITSDAFPKQEWEGKVLTVDSTVDEATRNVKVRAVVDNKDEKLRPGMFVDVAVLLPNTEKVVVVPATAIAYAPYGDRVFVVNERQNDGGETEKFVKQTIVRLGERRGDFVAVSQGLNPGQTVVTSGAYKLQENAPVAITDKLAPDAKISPKPEDS